MAERPRLLHVALHDDVIAHLHQQREGDPIWLTHTDVALERWGERIPVVSCSLPVSRRRQDASAFLEGLLPEGDALRALAARRDLRASDTWGLIASYGRDVAGALTIVDPEADAERPPPGSEPYGSDDELAATVAALPDQPLGVHDDSELSLAGLQEKLLLVAADTPTGFARPTHGMPSTHILKPDPLAHPGVVVAEHEALTIARRCGLTTVDAELRTLDGRPCLIVRRYDRASSGDGATTRVHQEDLLQAVGRAPHERGGRIKYQEHGGPGFVDAAALLRDRAEDPEGELRRLAGLMVFTVLIGNADGHAKNVSLLLDPPGTVRLAPLYDPVPTVLFPRLRVRCAMWINYVHDSLEKVTREDLIAEIAGRDRWRIGEAQAATWVDEWAAAIADATDDSRTGNYIANRARRLAV